MPRGRKKRHWLPIVAFLLVATSGIGIGLLIGYALGRLHRGEGPPKPLPVRIEALSNRGDKIKTFRGKVADAFQHQIFDYRYSDVPDGKGRARGHRGHGGQERRGCRASEFVSDTRRLPLIGF
jgi:hypothetical protein